MKDLIARVLSPHRVVRVWGKTYKVKQNISWELQEESQALTDSIIHKYRFEKLLRRNQVEPILQRLGFAIDSMPELTERIKSLKKELYKKFPDIIAQRPYRSQLLGGKKELVGLYSEIGSLDTHTLEFFAEKMGAFHCIKHTLIKCSRSHREDFSFLENVYYALLRDTVSVDKLRGLSRNDYWRNVWSSKKMATFRLHPLTEEQLALASFSRMYDNIMNHSEPPPQAVIDDDDMLDGWLLLQQEDRGKKKQPTYGHKIDSAKEVFIMAQGQDHANNIYEMNDPEQRAVQRVREKQLGMRGRVEFGQFADVQRNVQNATR